jgi:hypothetical protein
MSLIIRVDVDRAYGAKNIFYKSLSFLASSLPVFPKLNFLGYLNDLKEFISFVDKYDLKIIFFFRRCTIPNKNLLCLLNKKKYSLGWHTENTFNYDSFKREFIIIKNKIGKFDYFSKHGSGLLHYNKLKKFGYYHDPEYNLEKFILWGSKLKLKYFFGNEEKPALKFESYNKLKYIKGCFWINPNYRNSQFSLDWLLNYSKKRDVVLLIHPCNWRANKEIYNSFKYILDNYEL